MMKKFILNFRGKINLKILALAVFAGLLTAGYAVAQTGGDPSQITKPEIETKVNASEQEAEDAVGVTTIIAKVPEADRCECGAVFEAKRADATDWVVLGIISPEEAGDTQANYQWAYTANYFEINKEFDVRAKVFNRIGHASEYGTKRFTMKAEAERPCSDGVFANIEKQTTGSGENALILLFWDKVCSQTKEANKYKVYKNGQLLSETDHGATYFVDPGTPGGATWKIEAYGEEPPNNDPAIITACDQVKSKMNAKGGNVAEVEHCQVSTNNWLRVMVKFNPVPVGGPYPAVWLDNSRGNPPTTPAYFNYPSGGFWVPPPPQPPNGHVWNANVLCSNQTSTNGNYFPSTDPWSQTDWICPQPEYQGQGAGVLTTWRAWANFYPIDTGGSGGAWPVTTEFVY